MHILFPPSSPNVLSISSLASTARWSSTPEFAAGNFILTVDWANPEGFKWFKSSAEIYATRILYDIALPHSCADFI